MQRYRYLLRTRRERHARPAPLPKLPVKSNSQSGQDVWVLEQLRHKRNGYFVDIGASDGVTISNTYLLEKEHGWTGIAVEPNRVSFEKLKANRTCFLVNKCVAPAPGTVNFVEFTEHRDLSGILASYTDEGTREVKHGIANLIETDGVLLVDVLRQFNSPQVIDYLSMDIEGGEYEVLRTFPFDEFRFLTITVEHNNHLGEKQLQKQRQIRKLLLSHGYSFRKSCGVDDFYVHCGRQ